MLNLAFKENENYENLIFHSDQGWQYQHNSYQERLKEKKITQSMSRKGNSLDNGLMECFFGLLKSEMFYEQEEKYKTLEELKEALEDYIYYYNNKRIKEKLKGLTPVSYRNQSLLGGSTILSLYKILDTIPTLSIYPYLLGFHVSITFNNLFSYSESPSCATR